MIRRLSVIAVALGLATLAGPADAQMGPPPPPHDMMDMRREMGPPSPEMETKMAEHRAQMARDMHVVLRLRPDQESAWQAYEAAMAPPRFDHPMGPPEGPPPTTPQRLDHMDKMTAEMQAHHARMEAATRAFYAALSPDQQQVFDALERLRGPHMGGPRVALIHKGAPGRRRG